MASSHGGKDVMESEVNNSEATVEIKIKTLDSQTYTLRVDKQVPVPALKEQIASVTGVLSDQQRLICRGKVLKDDQLLSAYHVEDGHTLHLVARQPINPSLASFSDHSGSDPASNSRQSMGSQHGPSVVVGTFNISDQGDGGIPDFSRIVSAVLGSFGIANAASGGETVDLQQHISERLSRIPGLNEIRSSNGQPQQQPEDLSGRSQPNSQNTTFSLPTDVSMESLQLPVIPDSLSTLSQYLRRLRQEFNDNVRIQGNNNVNSFGNGEGSGNAPNSSIGQAGLPTPSALGEVTNSTRQLLIEQAGECLQQLTRQLTEQTNVTDPVSRLRTQSYALRSGALLQNLGAFLLELGRTTMTLRLGQSPTEAVVNAGPAVFISTSGPNPIMVQPLPFQPGTSFGTASSGPATFSVGSGLRPRNIDIRIRTGSVLSSGVNQREGSNGEQTGNESGTTNQEGGTRSRGSEVRVVPIRISTMPPGLAPSETSRSSMGVIYPVLARAQSVEVGNVNGSNGQVSNGGETRPHVVPDTEVPSGLDQLLRNLFSGEQVHGINGESVQTGGTSQEPGPPAVTDEGAFLSNLLHQILPVVSQHLNGQPSTSAEENQDRAASSQQSDEPPSSKRQKRE